MENFPIKEDDQIVLLPGFRFHPSDEELITHYLSEKVLDNNFSATAIGEVDMNKIEPWDLPRKAKMGEKEWYFFCLRDKKYPTGLRTNRATAAGYWKATGKDKEIFRGKSLVGMKKTLVFYKGRAPKGEKSNWVIHEFRLEGEFSHPSLPNTAKNEWVICRLFYKSSRGKKIHISELMRFNSTENEVAPNVLPPLMYSSAMTESHHVACFFNTMDIQNSQEEMINYFNNHPFTPNASENIFQRISLPNSHSAVQSAPSPWSLQFSGTLPMQDQTISRGLFQNYGSNLRQNLKTEEIVGVSQETGLSTDMNIEIWSAMCNLDMGSKSFDDQEEPSASVGAPDLDYLWNY